MESFTEDELRELYALIATESQRYPVDSREFYLLTKDMADLKGKML